MNDACIVSSRYKCGVYATTALAAATSSSCFVSATATAASRKRKITKKNGSPSGSQGPTGLIHCVPIGDDCVTSDNNCAIPPGLTHGVCRDSQCQSGTSGSLCGVTSDCVKPPGLQHPVCRNGKCQRGVCGDYCGQNNDCLSGMYCTNGTKKCVPTTNCSCNDFNNRAA